MDNWDKFIKFIEEVRAGAFATVDGDKPQVRAVVFSFLDEKNVMYTTTGFRNRKVEQIRNNPNVSFFIWKDHTFFRGGGEAEIINDVMLKKRILDKNPRLKNHYPLGPEDPKYCLIKIKINNLEMNIPETNNE
jgi:uncharacterized pyridoxamine 5'-phosphate oxidase family protein